MATAQQSLFSIVLVGNQNPNILSHDFLVVNEVLPRREPFFKDDLPPGEVPFDQFVSTPPFAQIHYEAYSLQVHLGRFQALDATGGSPVESPIIEIVQAYFGRLLRFTPFELGGINLHCNLVFDDRDDERRIDAILGIAHERANAAFSAPDVTMSVSATFAFLEGTMSVALTKPKAPAEPATINFNYEFAYPGNMDDFLARLDSVSAVTEYGASFYERLGLCQ